MSLNIKAAIRSAIASDMTIAAMLGTYLDGSSIHTIRPVPEGAGYPMVVIDTPNVAETDAVNSPRPIVEADIAIYGQQPAHYRAVEEVAYNLRELFHRNRWALDVAGNDLRVVEITAMGPRPAPTDDEKTVGLVLILTIRLQEI